jgi:hypothetical protein
VRKAYPEEEYGFNLHAEKGKGQFIGHVDAGSPAERAGLIKGDHIIGVNGELIEGLSHKSVVGLIKADPLQTDLFVIDEPGLGYYHDRGLPITFELAESGDAGGAGAVDDGYPPPPPSIEQYGTSQLPSDEDQQQTMGYRDVTASIPPPDYDRMAQTTEVSPAANGYHQEKPLPLLCILQKQGTEDEFGFNLHAEPYKGHFVGDVDDDSVSSRSGLRQGQRIVGINGTLIYPHSVHQDVIGLIKRDPMRAELLVASEATDRWYSERGESYDWAFYEPGAAAEFNGRVSNAPPFTNGTATYGGYPSHEKITTEHESGAEEALDSAINEQEDKTHGASSDLYSRNEATAELLKSHESYEDRPTERSVPAQSSGNPAMDEIMNMSVHEARRRLAKAKYDPRKEEMSLREKFNIATNL